jgi:Complex I intermediate-associated protein 30 (CIA30)
MATTKVIGNPPFSVINWALTLTDLSNKTFTFILKDTVPPTYTDPDSGRNREESTILYEANFRPSEDVSSAGERIVLPFAKFKPVYRGRDKPDAPPLDLSNIRRMSLMTRRWESSSVSANILHCIDILLDSFFDAQDGPFKLTVVRIAAFTASTRRMHAPEGFMDPYDELDDDEHVDGDAEAKGTARWSCGVQ